MTTSQLINFSKSLTSLKNFAYRALLIKQTECTTFFKNCAEINSRKFMFCKFRLEILPSNSCVWNSKLFFHIFMDWNLTENWKPYSDWKTSCSLMASLPRGQQVGIKNWRLHLDIGNHFFVLSKKSLCADLPELCV